MKPVLTDPATEKEIAEIEKQTSLRKLKEFAKDTLGEYQNIDFFVSEQKMAGTWKINSLWKYRRP